MTATDNQTINVEKPIEVSQDWLRAVPPELTSIIPETVWMSLSVDNKKEILRQHNLLEKYDNPQNPSQSTEKVEISAQVIEKPSVIVQEEQKAVRSPEFEQALEDLKLAKESETKQEESPVLAKEDIVRIDAEKAQSASVKTYNFFGYQPSQTTYTNAKQISNDGDISDSKTWAATLIGKILSLFQ